MVSGDNCNNQLKVEITTNWLPSKKVNILKQLIY